MKRIVSIFVLICLAVGLCLSPISVFAAEDSAPFGSTSTRFKAISAGVGYTVALKEDGNLVAWGRNDFNQCIIPSGLSGVKAIAAGSLTEVLKEDGTVVEIGQRFESQVPLGLKAVKAIASGDEHTLALKEDGTLVAWGNNRQGECTVPAGLTDVKAIAAGEGYSLALKEDGTIVAWGDNSQGQCTIPSGLSNVKAIAAGIDHAIALKEDGTIVAWGNNSKGQCTVPAGLTDVDSITAGYMYTVALKKDGTIVAWGDNEHDQCNVPSGLSGIKAISACSHTVALREDGTLVVWGNNYYGQCTIPFESLGLISIAPGYDHTVALKEDGTLIAWGHNNAGQCDIPKGLSGVKAIAAGNGHTVALKSDGTLVAWGNNGFGQCNIPKDLSNVKAIDAGNGHTVALKSDGTVVAWGNNDSGQCNIPKGLSGVKAIAAGGKHTMALKEDSTIVDFGDIVSPSPYELSNIKAIATGESHALALKKDGTVNVWGDPSFHKYNIPYGLSGIKAIADGTYDTVTLKEDGTVDIWGVPYISIPDVKAIYAKFCNNALLKYDGAVVQYVSGYSYFNFLPFPKAKPINSITPSTAVFDTSNPNDIDIELNDSSSKLLAIKNGPSPLTGVDYSISGNTVTIKKSYLSYFFNKFSLPSQKLNLTFDFEDGSDSILTVSRTVISNYISCYNPVFYSLEPQDIKVKISGSCTPLKSIKINSALLTSADYSVSGNIVTIKKSYLSYYFGKFSALWQRLNLVFDFESGNDPLLTISQGIVSNYVYSDYSVFNPSDPQDITVSIYGNTLNTIKNGSASLNSSDYSISGSTVTIKKSYLKYFFTKFTDPWQKLNLTFDFEKGNDPLFSISKKSN